VFDVVNRGYPLMWLYFFGTPDGPETSANFLLERGFSVLGVGWQHDIPAGSGRFGLTGGFVPFTRNEQERKTKGDPRSSLAERYPTLETFVGRMTVAALKCVQDGYLLEEDVASLLRSAKRQFESLTNTK
jgi:hypothetical protein